jgi:cellulose synthase/poly-beta-1,6-N-acetylglucosamine synthase-like glycosyltransferase
MTIALAAFGAIMMLLSLPAVIELGMFLFAHLLRSASPRKIVPATICAAIDSIAVLVPAHDEEKDIERCVRSLLVSDAGRYQRAVVVIADNCRDRTAELAREAGARVIERFDEKLRGKGAAIQYAIHQLEGEAYQAYLIVDADSVVSQNFVRAMGDEFASGKEAIQCVYLVLNTRASPRIGLMNLALLSMNVLRPAGREILGISVGIMGNGFGLTRNLLEEIPYTANSITEDLEYHLQLIESGRRVRFISTTRVLADFPASKEGAETQRARWEGGRFMLQRKFFPRLMRQILSGRGSMLEPLLELMSLPLSYEVLCLLVLLPLPGSIFFPYGCGGLIVIFLHILASIAIYGNKSDVKALFSIPAYIFWKLLRLPNILLASRKGTNWIRTKRD